MRTLYESILDSDETTLKNTEIDAIRNAIFSTCECIAEYSSVEIDGNKIYLNLQWSTRTDCYLDWLTCDASYKCLTDIMKSYEIYYHLYKGYYEFLSLATYRTSGPIWNKIISNAIKLFNSPKWHWCTSDRKPISGKFSCKYTDYSYLRDGDTRDYKELCKWLIKNSDLDDLEIEIGGGYTSGKATCKNIDFPKVMVGSGDVDIDIVNSNIGTLKIGRFGSNPDGQTELHNTKVKKLEISSGEYGLDKAMRCLFNDIDLKAYELRGYSSQIGKIKAENILDVEFETIKDNIKELGDPEIIIHLSRSRSHVDCTLKEYHKKYILKKL